MTVTRPKKTNQQQPSKWQVTRDWMTAAQGFLLAAAALVTAATSLVVEVFLRG
jgi:negative regulator of sigma E activity